MDLVLVEKIIAIVGGIVVFAAASISLKNDWKAGGLDGNVTKLMLGLMAFGCLLAIAAAAGILGPKGGA